MSNHSDRVHRHARWILEAASRRLGDAEWCDGPIALLRIEFSAYSTRAEWVRWAYDDWFPCLRADAATLLRGLLHDRLVAEAVEEYHLGLLECDHRGAWMVEGCVAEAESARAGEAAALERVADLEALDDRQYALSQEIEEALEEERDTALAGEAAALEEVVGLRRKLRDLQTIDGAWRWMGDGTDGLESMSADMAVLISAEQLQALEQDSRHLAEAAWRRRVDAVRVALEHAGDRIDDARWADFRAGLRRALELLEGDGGEAR